MHTSIETSPSSTSSAQNGAGSQRDDALIGTRETVRNPKTNGHEEIPTPSPAHKSAGKKSLTRALGAFAALIVAVGAGFYYVQFVAPYESSDDAFLENHVVSISAKLSNTVKDVLIDDNNQVKKGQLLVQIDPRDYEVALHSAQAGYDKAKSDYDRDLALVDSSAVSKQDLDAAHAAFEDASAKLDQAKLNLEYTRITAPADGKITRKNVEPGGYVEAGQPLFAIVPNEMWVVANFKETQLTHMRVGQKAEIKVDAYPQYTFSGRVESIQSGSGARFSLFPPENATGNYIKVVQRVPVKIVLDDNPDLQAELGPGMSVVPTVRVK
jgi:membrane fusion protein (multidrug efflux system)